MKNKNKKIKSKIINNIIIRKEIILKIIIIIKINKINAIIILNKKINIKNIKTIIIAHIMEMMINKMIEKNLEVVHKKKTQYKTNP